MLALEAISAAYGMSRVLYDIDLKIGPAETVTLLGRNGVGKTTLLRTIVGLHPASEGKVIFGGEDITRLSAHQRARRGIGYVPQGRGIFPHLTVEENLRLALAALSGRKLSPERISRLSLHAVAGEDEPAPRSPASGSPDTAIPSYIYDLFPVLGKFRNRKGGVLSGGEQQQLAIGRALVTRPTLLIFDEPTEGIQPSIVQQINEAIKIIQTQLKISILLVEQYLDFVWSVADRFYVMRKGRVVDEGSPQERDPGSVVPLLSI